MSGTYVCVARLVPVGAKSAGVQKSGWCVATAVFAHQKFQTNERLSPGRPTTSEWTCAARGHVVAIVRTTNRRRTVGWARWGR